MKAHLLTLFLVLLLPTSVFAAVADVDLETGVQLSVSGYILTISGRSSLPDSITVNSDNFTVTTTGGVFLQVTSADRRKFTVSPDQYIDSSSCDSTQSIIAIRVPNSNTSSVTVTVTPSTTDTCTTGGGGTSGGGGSVGGGGGGGGGGGSSPASAPPAPAPRPVAVPASSRDQQISDLQNQLAGLNDLLGKAGGSAPTGGTTVYFFKHGLRRGVKNDEVLHMQQLLKTGGFIAPDVEINGYFGRVTETAVKEFQKAHGLEMVGFVGPGTRAALNKLSEGQLPQAVPSSVVPTPVSPSSTVAPPAANTKEISDLQNQLKALNDLLKTATSPSPAPVSPPAPAPSASNAQQIGDLQNQLKALNDLLNQVAR